MKIKGIKTSKLASSRITINKCVKALGSAVEDDALLDALEAHHEAARLGLAAI